MSWKHSWQDCRLDLTLWHNESCELVCANIDYPVILEIALKGWIENKNPLSSIIQVDSYPSKAILRVDQSSTRNAEAFENAPAAQRDDGLLKVHHGTVDTEEPHPETLVALKGDEIMKDQGEHVLIGPDGHILPVGFDFPEAGPGQIIDGNLLIGQRGHPLCPHGHIQHLGHLILPLHLPDIPEFVVGAVHELRLPEDDGLDAAVLQQNGLFAEDALVVVLDLNGLGLACGTLDYAADVVV